MIRLVRGDLITCTACDGDGSLTYQWAKKTCVKIGGSKVDLPDGSWYYQGPNGEEIAFKTIGGKCSECRGHGTILKVIPCSECHGKLGWFVDKFGNKHLNEEKETLWVNCPECTRE